MSEEKLKSDQTDDKKDEDVVKNEEDEKSSPPAEDKPPKKKYVFNCTKCGQCCEKREHVPVSFDDIRKWTQSGAINSVFPHLKDSFVSNSSIAVFQNRRLSSLQVISMEAASRIHSLILFTREMIRLAVRLKSRLPVTTS